MENRGAVAAIAQLEPGQTIGDYEILAVSGTGGMGVVYRARQRSLGRVVALKVIRSSVATIPEYRERFLREARLAASIDHPHVVSVYYVGDEQHQLFLATQWIDGEDLREVLDTSGRLSAERAVRIAAQLAGALDAVHGVGLIHRDVKPANVLLRQLGSGDHAYLTDFGIAKPSESTDQLTQTGWVVGTAGYLSPEQIRGLEPGPQSDLYALGCVVFETLTGRPPFVADNEMALSWAHANDPRPTASEVVPTLGQRYDHFFSVALAVDPEERFGSGREFADALAAAHTGQDAALDTPPAGEPHTATAVSPPIPIPPRMDVTPQAQPLHSAYGYVTPPPAGYVTPPPPVSSPSRSTNPLAVILLGLVALAGIAAGVLAAAGVFSHPATTQTITSVSNAGAVAKRASSHPSSSAPQTAASAGSATSGTTSCGGDLSVGPNTSCGFAENVESAYGQTAGGDQVVTAYSPATGRTYTIACSAGLPHVCTGGSTDNASVYFTSGPTSAPAASAASAGALSACGSDVSVNRVTSCPFAANVLQAFAQQYHASPQTVMTVRAYSPVTHLTYNMSCVSDGTTVNCTGGKGSFLTFPLRAAQNY